MSFEKVGQNTACPCGSGKKAKRCCYRATINRGPSEEDLSIERTFDEWFSASPFPVNQPVFVARFTADAGFAVPFGTRPQRLVHLFGRPAHLRFSTEWTLQGALSQPGLLHVTALCTAVDLADAARFLENRTNVALYAMVVAMNAWCTPVREYAVVELTANVRRRQLRRSPRQPEPESARPVRRLDDDLAKDFTWALWSSPHVDRLLYAVQHYVQAMDQFRTGASPMCLEHLFIAVEALKPIVLAQHRSQTGWSDTDYVTRWNLRRASQIEAASRLHLIFDGDRSTYDGASDASNSMEHGNATYAVLWDLAERHHVVTARYVRRAIIHACNVDPSAAAKLLSRRYDTPMSDVDHLADQHLLIEATRADIISGRSAQLHASRRIPTATRIDRERDVLDFEYKWESVRDKDAEIVL